MSSNNSDSTARTMTTVASSSSSSSSFSSASVTRAPTRYNDDDAHAADAVEDSAAALNNYIQLLPQHLRIAENILSDVEDRIGSSRLVRNSNGLWLAKRSELIIEKKLGQGAYSNVYQVKRKGGQKVYAMKQLQMEFMEKNPHEFQRAAAELAVEAHMLAALSHPNIIPIRGWTDEGVASYRHGNNDFFLLLDVLDETLDKRILKWERQEESWRKQSRRRQYYPLQLQKQKQQQQNQSSKSSTQRRLSSVWKLLKSPFTSSSSNSSSSSSSNNLQYFKQEQVYLEKLGIMVEIASALEYLHQKGILFRDLKPNNIGFTSTGRVQLFDLGLSRELPLLNVQEPFYMSGAVGTLRYMATEVAKKEPYNVSADVYSFAMVSYEMLTLEKPYCGWTPNMFHELACQKGHRPSLSSKHFTIKLSSQMKSLLQSSWHANPYKRPTMAFINQTLKAMEEEQMLIVSHALTQQRNQVDQLLVELPKHFQSTSKNHRNNKRHGKQSNSNSRHYRRHTCTTTESLSTMTTTNDNHTATMSLSGCSLMTSSSLQNTNTTTTTTNIP